MLVQILLLLFARLIIENTIKILMLNRVNVCARTAGADCQEAPNVLNNPRRLPAQGARSSGKLVGFWVAGYPAISILYLSIDK